MTIVEITQLPTLNSVVIKQKEGHLFIAAPNSFIIDRAGMIRLILELLKVGFLDYDDLEAITEELYYGEEQENENTKDGGGSGIG
jgi:hypothetical protein